MVALSIFLFLCSIDVSEKVFSLPCWVGIRGRIMFYGVPEDFLRKIDDIRMHVPFSEDYLKSLNIYRQTRDPAELINFFDKKYFLTNDTLIIIGEIEVHKSVGKIFSGVIGQLYDSKLHLRNLKNVSDNFKIKKDVKFIAVYESNVFGYFDDVNCEALILPHYWDFGSFFGPSILLVKQLRRRFKCRIVPSICSMFEVASAKKIINPLLNDAVGIHFQVLEYTMHELGHLSNDVFSQRLRRGKLTSIEAQALEELRADMIGFSIAKQLYDSTTVKLLFLSNLCLRLGYDLHREVENNQNSPHAICSNIIMNFLTQKGVLSRKESSKYEINLSCIDNVYDDLISWAESQTFVDINNVCLPEELSALLM